MHVWSRIYAANWRCLSHSLVDPRRLLSPLALSFLGEDGAHRQRGETFEKFPVNLRPILGAALVLRRARGKQEAEGRGVL